MSFTFCKNETHQIPDALNFTYWTVKKHSFLLPPVGPEVKLHKQ